MPEARAEGEWVEQGSGHVIAIDSCRAAAYAMKQIRITLTGHEREVGGVLPKERERHRVQAFPGKCF